MPKTTTKTVKAKTVAKKTKVPQRVSARLRNLRMAPRKVRLVADLIKGQNAEEALAQLKFRTEKAARPLEKLLASALANAENNAELVRDNMKIEAILVDPGMVIKRFQPRARGSANRILKRSSHITIQLSEIEAGKKAPKKKATPKAAPKAKAAKPAKTAPAKETKTTKTEVKEIKEETTDAKKSALPGTTPLDKKGSQGSEKKGFGKNLFHRRGNM